MWANSAGLERGLRICVLIQFPSDVDDAGPGPHFETLNSTFLIQVVDQIPCFSLPNVKDGELSQGLSWVSHEAYLLGFTSLKRHCLLLLYCALKTVVSHFIRYSSCLK